MSYTHTCTLPLSCAKKEISGKTVPVGSDMLEMTPVHLEWSSGWGQFWKELLLMTFWQCEQKSSSDRAGWFSKHQSPSTELSTLRRSQLVSYRYWVQTIYCIHKCRCCTIMYCVYRSSLEGASNRLVDFVLSCLQEEKVAHPSGMEEMLKDLLGNGEKKLSLHKPDHTIPEKV